MTQLKNKTLLVTGGASGIGKELVQIALKKEVAKIVIWDKNETSLNDLLKELSATTANKIPLIPIVADVSNLQDVISAAEATRKQAGSVDILINNAGILIGKLFHEHSHSEIHKGMVINANGYMHVAREFLPEMLERKSGHICNIASAAGLIGNPNMSIYCASKAAVVGWSDSLRIEMKQLRTNVRITAVTPNYINTDMINGVKSIVPIIKKEKAAQKIIRAIEKNKNYERIQPIVYTIPFLKGILSVNCFDLFVGRYLGVYNSMQHYSGRNNMKTSDS